jgi:hypothetical protein
MDLPALLSAGSPVGEHKTRPIGQEPYCLKAQLASPAPRAMMLNQNKSDCSRGGLLPSRSIQEIRAIAHNFPNLIHFAQSM